MMTMPSHPPPNPAEAAEAARGNLETLRDVSQNPHLRRYEELSLPKLGHKIYTPRELIIGVLAWGLSKANDESGS